MLMIDSWGAGTREFTFRVLMTLVLAPLGVWAVITGGLVLAGVVGMVSCAAAFEWSRMMCPDRRALVSGFFLLGALGGVGCVIAAYWGFGAVLLVAVGTAVLAAGLARAVSVSVKAGMFGAVYTSLPFGAFLWLRNEVAGGEIMVLGLLAIVWATDIAAYFAGRGFGGPLLAPLDSPNKTWTGAIGALICACLAGAAIARIANLTIEGWIIAGALLSLVAQAGDLLESRIKRRYQVKDTSGLIPGHGGVLDRLDALMAASAALAIFVWLFPAQAGVLIQWRG